MNIEEKEKTLETVEQEDVKEDAEVLEEDLKDASGGAIELGRKPKQYMLK